MTVAEIENATFGYSDRPVLSDVSLTVEDGEFLGLVGPNGSGKSTLLELVLGLQTPDKGTVRLFGEPPQKGRKGGRVGYVAQNVTAVSGMPVTVREIVTAGRSSLLGFGFTREKDREAVEYAMETVGISNLANRRVARLSGGQQQRAFIARALAADADVLVLDEPTVGVDAESREEFYNLLHDLNEDGLAVILVEHDIGVVTERADRIACLNRKLYFHGDTDEFEASEVLAEAYGANQRQLHHDHD
ncbi:metal ABC transporter ATP-binding protein [Haladaptatus pallidirubidus]|uniref:Cobalamin import ATP-binding protein BtuD n=1 Tax=Haladaptatus pallidirubidus TaxID=1008152 RepID=A0AAV3UMT4_9EURY|nr:metal ABC transporter ATP-binding protein [Haladaptatus pallidirubidus]